MKKSAAVIPYDPKWVDDFNLIRSKLLPGLSELIVSFEHVGSTSVPGLAAKPVIDIDVIYERDENLPTIIKNLEAFGYRYEGNKGIEGRESFKAPEGAIRQHFYVCKKGCLALRNHLILRDHLRNNPKDADEYGALKLSIAHIYQESPADYLEAKTSFILGILKRYEMSMEELGQIKAANTPRR